MLTIPSSRPRSKSRLSKTCQTDRFENKWSDRFGCWLVVSFGVLALAPGQGQKVLVAFLSRLGLVLLQWIA
ncbi:MAG: hypothetical protein PHO89_06270, partial [Methylacidiphilaceae bacterium]|nr:hypothetical protein [Candidatus Methylacidiphilaceae bacterium]